MRAEQVALAPVAARSPTVGVPPPTAAPAEGEPATAPGSSAQESKINAANNPKGYAQFARSLSSPKG
eukprot:14572706-Alexandrium_andersonii.AAC.1